MPRVRLPGTRRDVEPEVTWERIRPLLPEYGITRIADVTGLDNIGVPVVLAVRPASQTLAVSQGKGANRMLATLSAVMESIELQHAENPAAAVFTASARELPLPYRTQELNLASPGLDVDALRLRWTQARVLATGEEVPVPWDVVRLSFSGSHFWQPRLFRSSSTGLASGNTHAEACLHALYEVIERDVTAGLDNGDGSGIRVAVDPDTIADPGVRELLDRLHAAGVEHAIAFLPNRYEVPTFVAYVWSPLYPVVCAGAGSHMDVAVALSRAVTEAVQSRLTEIAATRDDLPSHLYALERAALDPGLRHGPGAQAVPFSSACAAAGADYDDTGEELAQVAQRVREVSGRPPLVVDLSTRPELFSVVRVVCPGLVHTTGRTVAY